MLARHPGCYATLWPPLYEPGSKRSSGVEVAGLMDIVVTESSNAVFLSYASEDAASAQRIAEALRAAGIEVWFDKDALRGGDAWDRMIRQQIHDCALFIPLVSQHSQERLEGYFRTRVEAGCRSLPPHGSRAAHANALAPGRITVVSDAAHIG
jgi:hypothetical protein